MIVMDISLARSIGYSEGVGYQEERNWSWYGLIAQWLEHLVYVQKVLGSIPGLVTFLYSNRLWAPPCACLEMVIQEVSD